MRLQEFHLELFERPSAAQQTSLRELLQAAFADADPADDPSAQADLGTPSWHVLARDATGRALGCGILAANGRIDGVTVREESRGQGIGTAIIHELLARARTLGMREVSVSARADTMAFFHCAGFLPDTAKTGTGDVLRCALPLPRQREAARPQPLADIGALPAGSQGEVAAARLQLLTDARHQLRVYLPLLHAGIFANPAELQQLRRIACSGRSAGIHILLHDPAAALAIDHPLLPLAQRLTSAFQIRTPTDLVDLAYASAYLLTDSGGYLFLPDASRPAGRAARTQRSAQIPLRQHFDATWERAERASILNALDL